MIVSYDGTDFAGWQWQPHKPSVVGAMQSSFFRVFNEHIKLLGASRTDAGVHAFGQVATFTTGVSLASKDLMRVWNDALPPTIVIKDMMAVDDSFHPMLNVAQKTYWYHFFLERPLPYMQRYGWYFRYPVDLICLQEALHVFVGTHDFRSFCTDIAPERKTVRHIESIQLEQTEFGAWRIVVKGPGFLRHMIRRIVGASLEVASKKKITPEDLRVILAQKNANQSLLNAPAQGLCLYEIIYTSQL